MPAGSTDVDAAPLWPPRKPEVLWFDRLTGTALVLEARDLHRVSLFPGPRVVIQTGDCAVACSRTGRGWGVEGLGGRPTAHQLLAMSAVASAVLERGKSVN